MKKGIKKNQVIISALAVLIAVAGYIRCGSALPSKNEEYHNVMEEIEYDATDELSANTTYDSSVQSTLSDEKEVAVNDVDPDPDSISLVDPGSAVLTSTSATGIVSSIKLEREQTRAKNKETLLSIINNPDIMEQQKTAAIDQMLAITDIMEKENAAETMLKSQGFYDSIVSISDDKVDIVIDMAYVNDDNIVQIEDIIKRKTGVTADKITIVPMGEEVTKGENTTE